MIVSSKLLTGNAMAVLASLPAECAHVIVTSPPYWGLRDYKIEPVVWGGDVEHQHVWGDEIPKHGRGERGPDNKQAYVPDSRNSTRGCWCSCGAWRGCYGLEPTLDLYIEHTVLIFREVRRVLRKDGTLWLNIGDSYATGGGAANQAGGGDQGERFKKQGPSSKNHDAIIPSCQPNRMPQAGLKSKDLCMVPHRVALALQADGWWVRQDNVWAKPNPMTESVEDRPARSHEYVFLLSRSECYFYDHIASAEPQSEQERRRRLLEQANGLATRYALQRDTDHGQHAPGQNGCARSVEARQKLAERETRNRRSVWHITPTPFPKALLTEDVQHFATFPCALVEPCILAGTSERGVCPKCGAHVARQLERQNYGDWNGARDDELGTGANSRAGMYGDEYAANYVPPKTIGWAPTCKCNAGDPIPATVLDPFSGSGTTGYVAHMLGRSYIGIEMNPDYQEMARRSLEAVKHQSVMMLGV